MADKNFGYDKLLDELKFCVRLWDEKGGCSFGGGNECESCAAPYLLLKLINGEVIHGEDVKRLSLDDWKSKIVDLEDKSH